MAAPFHPELEKCWRITDTATRQGMTFPATLRGVSAPEIFHSHGTLALM